MNYLTELFITQLQLVLFNEPTLLELFWVRAGASKWLGNCWSGTFIGQMPLVHRSDARRSQARCPSFTGQMPLVHRSDARRGTQAVMSEHWSIILEIMCRFVAYIKSSNRYKSLRSWWSAEGSWHAGLWWGNRNVVKIRLIGATSLFTWFWQLLCRCFRREFRVIWWRILRSWSDAFATTSGNVCFILLLLWHRYLLGTKNTLDCDQSNLYSSF